MSPSQNSYSINTKLKNWLWPIRFILRNPSKVLITLLLLSPFGSLAKQMTGSSLCLPRNTSLFPYPDYQYGFFNCSRYRMSPSQVEQLEKDYITTGNVPIECAEFVIFAESHDNEKHQQLQSTYLSTLAQQKDFVLLESADQLQTVSPSEFSALKNKTRMPQDLVYLGWDKPKRNSNANKKFTALIDKYNIIFNQKYHTNPQLVYVGLLVLREMAPGFTEEKFGNICLLKPHEFKIITEDVQRYEQQKPRETILSFPFAHRLLQIMAKFELPTQLAHIYNTMFGEENIVGFDKNIVKLYSSMTHDKNTIHRNDYMIETMRMLQCKNSLNQQICQRKIIISGARHFFNVILLSYINHIFDLKSGKKDDGITYNNKLQELLLFNMTFWAEDIVVTPLRNFMEKHTHYTLLFPR